MKITVIGMGGWGVALAVLLRNNGEEVAVWGRNPEKAARVQAEREQTEYLRGIRLPDGLRVTSDDELAADGAEIFVCATPSAGFRQTIRRFAPLIPEGSVVVSASKGIENGSLKRMTEIISEELPFRVPAALSGPGHAEEVGAGMPTAYVVSAYSDSVMERLQNIFLSPVFRVYKNPDVLGVELGGALKNVIALSTGMSDGMGYGDNAKAALMTRGISEIARLGAAMGALSRTFAGLSGIGDLIATCTSVHSRNRRAGILLGRGTPLDDALRQIHMTVEGVDTSKAAAALSRRFGVEMPIVAQVCKTLFEGAEPREAVDNLMLRDKTVE
jgi:glycerol-3-phosphate dehydrogenase (NAD(P)+)